MTDEFDLSAYVHRSGFRGELRPDLETLRGLVAAHVANIPFENLNPFLRLPVRLDIASLVQKMVLHRRGGYCFEHNTLFREALRHVGFDVESLIARVLWGRDDQEITAQSHMLLRVHCEGESYLVDVGFGRAVLSGALRLVRDEVQATPHEPYRLVESGGTWRMQAQLHGQWLTLYRFELQPRYDIDYVVANHYSSTFPESHFLHGLTIARTLPGRRLSLRSRDFGIHPTGGVSIRRTLTTTAEIRSVLEQEFGLALPDHPELEARLDALPMPETQPDEVGVLSPVPAGRG